MSFPQLQVQDGRAGLLDVEARMMLSSRFTCFLAGFPFAPRMNGLNRPPGSIYCCFYLATENVSQETYRRWPYMRTERVSDMQEEKLGRGA